MQIMAYTLALGMPGLTEWIIIGALGLLIFGKRLPEVGRSLGKGIVEFKKGLKGIEDEVEQVDQDMDKSRSRPVLTHEEKKPAFKFDPYTGKPVESEPSEPSTASH
jgi:sec-independent protein translocase protein TatA